jgi:hypothetical protein
VRAGRLLAIIISFVVLLGGGYAAWKLNHDKREYAQKQRETALKAALLEMRTAIRRYEQENDRYPHNLEELVPKYLRRIPQDPIAQNASWRLVTEEKVLPSADFTTNATVRESYVVDVHSAAGEPYSGW